MYSQERKVWAGRKGRRGMDRKERYRQEEEAYTGRRGTDRKERYRREEEKSHSLRHSDSETSFRQALKTNFFQQSF